MKTKRRILTVSVTAVLLCGIALPAVAQEARGTIQGTLTDPQKAVLPGVTLTIVSKATNTPRSVVTNEIGYYEAPFLEPGEYTISAELAGFKKYVRSNIVLNVGVKMAVDIQLEVGGMEQTVTVTESAPLLDTTTSSTGRVIDTSMINSLPFSDLNPFALTGMAAGMQWTGQPEYRRPFDNGGTSSFNTSGGLGQNEYMIDGAPVTGTGRRVGFVPPADAIQEFNLQTTAFDATLGHTSGALVNVVSRSGSNNWHGALYDQHWQQRWNATPHFSRLLWEDAVKKGTKSANSQKQAPGRSNQFGGTVGGPVRLPWLYNGKDKFFFFFSYNGIYQSKAETTGSINNTVPKMAWRTGDFSDLLALDPVKYQIYDPRTARLSGGRVVRDPFVGNKNIPILNPMYKYYVDLYPKPNDVPGLVSAEGFNNYLAAGMPKNERFNSILNRFDYNFNAQLSIAGKWYWNHRLADEYDFTYETLRGLMRNGLTRINKGGSGDLTWTINNANVFQLTVSWTRFNEGSQRDVPNNYKPSDVGLPTYLDQKAGDVHLLPRLDFDNINDISQDYAAITTRGTTAEMKLAMSTIWGRHSLRYGYQERRYMFASSGYGYTSGRFQFNNSYMRRNDADTTAGSVGLEWAAFMMGLPSAGVSVDTNDTGYWTNPYRSAYLQDDWRMNRRLTVNLGLRYEFEGGIRERFSRSLVSGFYPDIKLPITDLVQSAYATIYAANPTLGLLPPSQFKVTGGVPYMNQSGAPGSWTNGAWKFLPRVGIAFQLNDKTVVRLGYGVFFDTLNVNNTRGNQTGFSKGTSTSLSNDLGLTFLSNYSGAAFPASALSPTKNILTDPFPLRADGTRFDAPFGNKLGYMSRAGSSWDNEHYQDYVPGLQQRWRFGIQRQLRRDIVFEGSYNGAYATIPLRQRINYLPAQYWATGMERNQAVDDNMNQNVTNPFRITNLAALQASDPFLYNYLNTVGFFTSSTIRKNALLRVFPQMSGTLSGVRPGLESGDTRSTGNYGDFQMRIEKRFSRDFLRSLTTSFSWTYVFKSQVADFYWNEFDARPSSRWNNNAVRSRMVWDSILRLPFGKNEQWLQKGVLNHVVGGWEVGWIYQKQSGPLVDWGNRFFYGDARELVTLLKHDQIWSKDIHQWFDPSIAYRGATTDVLPAGFVGFEGRSAKQPGSYHVRVFPSRISGVERDGIDNWDIKVQRKFRSPFLGEQGSTMFSIDFLNAFNKTNFDGPNTDPTSSNFGKVDTQRGLSRVIQFNLRFVF